MIFCVYCVSYYRPVVWMCGELVFVCVMQKVMIKMDTQSLPMFVPPRPWVAANDGCYLATPGEDTE